MLIILVTLELTPQSTLKLHSCVVRRGKLRFFLKSKRDKEKRINCGSNRRLEVHVLGNNLHSTLQLEKKMGTIH